MSVDLKTACRMAKASDVTYFIGMPGGPTACPSYNDVGFKAAPQTFVANGINAALVGTTANEVVLAFRGTLAVNTDDWNAFVESVLDWVNDGEANLVGTSYTVGLVHQGFDKSLDLLWDEALAAVEAQHSASKLPVVVAGHSKGGALATLAAMRLQKEAAITPAAVYTYGSPRVGNTRFADDYGGKILHSWRFQNADDLVPHLPPNVVLLDFLAHADARLADLSAHDYHHVDRLEFLDWNGGISEDSSFAADVQRLSHLVGLAATGRIQQVALDHSLQNQYIPKICGP